MNTYIEKSQELVALYLPKVAGAIILLVVGLFIIKHLRGILDKALTKAKVDVTLKPFIISFLSMALKVLLIVSVITMIGGELTSFVTIIGASSLAIGLSFQGALANFAGGVLLLTLRPFKVGDVISVSGSVGTVEAINVFNTVIINPDNHVITLPNGNLANSSVTNFTGKSTRRVELNFGVSYDEDASHVKSVLLNILNNHPLILKLPEPFVNIRDHADSAIIYVVRVWTNTENYWDVFFQLQELVHQGFLEANISFPYPKLDVTMIQKEK